MDVVTTSVSTPAALKPSWNPLRCTGSDLPKNLTIMVKTLAIVVLVVNHVRILPDPWLPFVPYLDRIPPVVFQKTLQIVFVLSALAIVFNRRIRLSSLVLGSTMLLAVISSKAYYGNNKTFCGLMFFLSGLYKPGAPNFLRWQLAITYFGAGLNKLLDPDWHSGIFFENWSVNRLHQPWYIAAGSLLPPMALARFMCWTTIVTELGIVPCLFIAQLNSLAVLSNVLFQASLCLFTGTTFTLFFYSMTAASLALVNWPAEPVSVFYDPRVRSSEFAMRFFRSWDLDRMFRWSPLEAGAATRGPLHLYTGAKFYNGFTALRMMVLLNPITYFVIAAAIGSLESVREPLAALLRRLIVTAGLVFLTPPLTWAADRIFRNPRGRTATSSGAVDNRITA